MDSAGGLQVEGYTPLRIDRLERKCLVEEISVGQIQAMIKLHPKLFYSPFPPRYVNSLYLDTKDLDNYFANVHGDADRRKVRIRWYGDLRGEITHPLLEIKIKQGIVGTKRVFPLAPIQVDGTLCDGKLQQVIEQSALPDRLRLDLRNLHLVLLNRYYRYYYVSQDGNFRVTLDTELSFFKVNYAFGNFFLHSQKCYFQQVVEIKYAKEYDTHANRVINFFPFRVTRSSKYVQGVERVYL